MEEQQKERITQSKEQALKYLNTSDKLDEAINLAQQMLFSDPKNMDAQYILAEAYFKKQDYANAVDCFRKLISFNPQIAWIQFGYGASLIKVGRVDEAVGHLLKAIELDPNDPEYYIAMGEYFFQKRKFKDSEYYFSKAVSLGTSNMGALNNYGILLLDHKNCPKEAVPILKRVMEANPHNPVYRKNYIRALQATHPVYHFLYWKKNRIRFGIFYVLWLALLFSFLVIGTPSKLKAYMFLFGAFVVPILLQSIVRRIASKEPRN